MTEATVDFIPTPDVLARDPRLAHSVELPVLGIATHFETNSQYVLSVVEDAFGGWRCVGETGGARDPGSGVRVRVVVHAGCESGAGHAPARHICPDATRLIVHTPGSVGLSDPARRESVAYVTTALAADRAHFRDAMLEAITLALLSHFDRHPIHAAAVARGGRAVLLAGQSGAGKSTLAYLAHTAAIDVLSDDRVWVQLAPAGRVWGWPGRVSLPAADGAEKIVLDLGDTPGPSRYVADRAAVCVLERGGARASLERLSPARLIEALADQLAPGFDRFPDRHDAVVRALAGDGGWRLTLSADPREALPLLQRMLNER